MGWLSFDNDFKKFLLIVNNFKKYVYIKENKS